MNQKIGTSLGTIIILIIAVTAGVFVWNAQKKCKTEPTNIETQKTKISNKNQTWHTENGERYVDDLYKFYALYPKGWNVEEELPIGPNENGWKRRIEFSNYKYNTSLDDVPDDYLYFELVVDYLNKCREAEKLGHKNTDDLEVWKNDFTNIKIYSEEYPSLVGYNSLGLLFGDYCLEVYPGQPEFTGRKVNLDEKISIFKNFVNSLTFF